MAIVHSFSGNNSKLQLPIFTTVMKKLVLSLFAVLIALSASWNLPMIIC